MSKSKRKLYDTEKINNFRELLNRYKNLYSSKVAFEYKKTPQSKEHITITYNQFVKDIEYLATSLLNLGLRGKRIALIGPNRYEWCVSYLAITTSDIVVVPLDKSLPDNEIVDLIKRSCVDAVIFDEKYLDVFRKISNANNTKSTASSNDIINLVIVGSVIVIGLPFLIWSIQSGITEPLEHITFP